MPNPSRHCRGTVRVRGSVAVAHHLSGESTRELKSSTFDMLSGSERVLYVASLFLASNEATTRPGFPPSRATRETEGACPQKGPAHPRFHNGQLYQTNAAAAAAAIEVLHEGVAPGSQHLLPGIKHNYNNLTFGLPWPGEPDCYGGARKSTPAHSCSRWELQQCTSRRPWAGSGAPRSRP